VCQEKIQVRTAFRTKKLKAAQLHKIKSLRLLGVLTFQLSGAEPLFRAGPPGPAPNVLGDDFFDRLAKVDFQPFLTRDFEPARIESELVQHGGMDVGNIVPVFHGMEA